MNTAANRALWNERASLGPTAGTQDLILKELEQRVLLEALAPWTPTSRILEVGCGLGETAQLVGTRFDHVLAIDNSPEMIARTPKSPHVTYRRAEVSDIDDAFHVIYTQRMVINLPNWEAQRALFTMLQSRLRRGGRLLICESSHDGLANLNRIRVSIGLPEITPPPHTTYLHDHLMHEAGFLVRRDFSSNYYFLSRVMNAKLAHDLGKEPLYDSPLNLFALHVPMDDGPYAQTKLWIYEQP